MFLMKRNDKRKASGSEAFRLLFWGWLILKNGLQNRKLDILCKISDNIKMILSKSCIYCIIYT